MQHAWRQASENTTFRQRTPHSASRSRASMRRGVLRLSCAAAVVAACGALGAPALAQARGLFKKGPTSSFTSSQADQGKAAYGDNCLMCHGGTLDDGQYGPPLKGAAFEAQWQDQSVDALFSYIVAKMPPTSPGELSQGTYADIEAYILQQNGEAAGTHELAPREIAAISGPLGPQERQLVAARQEHGNVLRPIHDAAFYAAIAARRAKIDAITPVTAEMLENPPAADWLTYRRSYASIGYSPLEQINTTNVGRLREAWAWQLAPSGNEITPLVHDGILFIKSANTIQALDGSNGNLLWQYVRTLPPALHNGRFEVVKSIAIYQDKLFAPTADGHIVALDVKTGKVVWDHEVLGRKERAHHLVLDGGPLVAENVVMMGTSNCSTYGGGCFIVGLDADNGKELWRFHTIARPGQPGGNSWNGAPVDERYGASVWTSGSYDPVTKLAYFGTGQTYDVGTLLLPHRNKGKSNDALYTDSTVALDPKTGKLVWYYQHMNRDVWDFDWAYEQSLLSLPVDDRRTPLLVTGGKLGIFDAVNRKTGKYAFSVNLGFQTLVSSINPKTGHKDINPKFEPRAGRKVFICPHPGGGRNWPATSYNPHTNMLYVESLESCMDFEWNPRSPQQTAAGGSDDLWIWHVPPHNDGRFGRLQAVDLKTGKIIWTRRQRAAYASSTLTTAGGLLFIGSRDRNFMALSAADGKLLWEARLDASPSSSPVTYSVDGNQYVAVVAGNGGPHAWPYPTPELANPSQGTTLWVFKLPSAESASR